VARSRLHASVAQWQSSGFVNHRREFNSLPWLQSLRGGGREARYLTVYEDNAGSNPVHRAKRVWLIG
jgi:hypothetical protein